MHEDQVLGIHCIIGGLILYFGVCLVEWLTGKPGKLSYSSLLGLITASSVLAVGIFFWVCCFIFAGIDKYFLN